MEMTYSLTRIPVKLTEVVRQFGESYHYKKPVSVPCGECKACCIGLKPQLRDDEAKKNYLKKYSKVHQCYHLKQKSDGRCVYLNEQGCSIHDQVPRVCQQFDCRQTALFNIRDPKRPDIDAARQRWIFEIDNQELADFMKQYFNFGIKRIDRNDGDQMLLFIRDTLIVGYRKLLELEPSSRLESGLGDDCGGAVE